MYCKQISNKVEETFIHVIYSQDIETTENYYQWNDSENGYFYYYPY